MKFSDRNKTRLKLIIYIMIPLIVLIHFTLIFTKDEGQLIPYKAAIAQNKVKINGLKLGYLIDNTSFIEVRSDTAWADKIDESVEMEQVNIDFKSKDTKVIARADTGVYELQKMLTATGNIKGKLNDLNFKSEDNGSIVYDYVLGKGTIKNGVFVAQEGSNIFADTATFDTVSEYVYFNGGVSVVYKESE